jgi:hypothetical protein
MNNDRELLEMAAKAAGIEWYGYYGDEAVECRYLDVGLDDSVVPWNPLTDDGDALRLAVKLKIGLRFPQDCDYYVDAGEHDGNTVYLIDAGNDRAAAARRAIVRAAAEIGKTL